MKHTQGKWKVDLSSDNYERYVITADIMSLQIIDNSNEAEANARLIAAAPDLLEACKYVIEQLKGVKGKTFPISPILNAIQKAEEKY